MGYGRVQSFVPARSSVVPEKVVTNRDQGGARRHTPVAVHYQRVGAAAPEPNTVRVGAGCRQSPAWSRFVTGARRDFRPRQVTAGPRTGPREAPGCGPRGHGPCRDRAPRGTPPRPRRARASTPRRCRAPSRRTRRGRAHRPPGSGGSGRPRGSPESDSERQARPRGDGASLRRPWGRREGSQVSWEIAKLGGTRAWTARVTGRDRREAVVLSETATRTPFPSQYQYVIRVQCARNAQRFSRATAFFQEVFGAYIGDIGGQGVAPRSHRGTGNDRAACCGRCVHLPPPGVQRFCYRTFSTSTASARRSSAPASAALERFRRRWCPGSRSTA